MHILSPWEEVSVRCDCYTDKKNQFHSWVMVALAQKVTDDNSDGRMSTPALEPFMGAEQGHQYWHWLFGSPVLQ